MTPWQTYGESDIRAGWEILTIGCSLVCERSTWIIQSGALLYLSSKQEPVSAIAICLKTVAHIDSHFGFVVVCSCRGKINNNKYINLNWMAFFIQLIVAQRASHRKSNEQQKHTVQTAQQ